jgi:hypothetical protein
MMNKDFIYDINTLLNNKDVCDQIPGVSESEMRRIQANSSIGALRSFFSVLEVLGYELVPTSAVNSLILKAYVVRSSTTVKHTRVVFAHSKGDAISLAFNKNLLRQHDINKIDAERQEEFDQYITKYGEDGYIPREKTGQHIYHAHALNTKEDQVCGMCGLEVYEFVTRSHLKYNAEDQRFLCESCRTALVLDV